MVQWRLGTMAENAFFHTEVKHVGRAGGSLVA